MSRKDDVHIEEQGLYTTVDYQQYEDGKVVTVKSIPIGKVILGASTPVNISEDFVKKIEWHNSRNNDLRVRESFTFDISETIEENREDNLDLLEEFSYEVIYAILKEVEDNLLLTDDFDLQVILSDRYVRVDDLNVNEDFFYRIPIDIEDDTSEDINVDEVFSSDIILALHKSEDEQLNVNELFFMRVADDISRSEDDIIPVGDSFSFNIVNPINKQSTDTITVSEDFLSFLANFINKSETNSINIRESFNVEWDKAEPPSEPQNVSTQTNDSSCYIDVFWNHPTTGEPDSYELEWDTPDGNTYSTDVSGSNTDYRIIGGGDGTYYIRIRAEQEGLTSDWVTTSAGLFCSGGGGKL